MKTRIAASTAAAAAVMLLAGGVFADAGSAKPAPGEVAPGFSLPSSKGNHLSLDDYRGRTVVLAFFVKAFTGG